MSSSAAAWSSAAHESAAGSQKTSTVGPVTTRGVSSTLSAESRGVRPPRSSVSARREPADARGPRQPARTMSASNIAPRMADNILHIMSDAPGPPVRRHHWIVRLTHWATLVLLIGMVTSGLQIYGAYARFGERGG